MVMQEDVNNKETYYTNPTYTLTIDQETTLVAEIRGPKKYSVNVRIEDMDQKKIEDTGHYRPGYAMLKTSIKPGKYIVRCSTFYANEIGPYFLDFKSDQPIKVQ